MAALLRGEGTPAPASNAKAGGYSYTDLDLLGRYVSELSSWERSVSVHGTDEGRMGLDLAMLSMKTDTLLKGGRASAAVSGTLQNLMNGFIHNFLDRMDDKLAGLRKGSAVAGDVADFAALDRQAFWNVYNRTMEQYKASGDVVEALIEGAKAGADQSLEKADSGAYRDKNSRQFWADFFDQDPAAASRPYTSAGSSYQKYMAGWKDFEISLQGSSMQVRLNMEMKSLDAYPAMVDDAALNVRV